jgi:TolB-like protein
MNRMGSDAIPASVVDLGERSVAVLPFVNSTGVDSLDWLGPGMSDMLTTNLAQTGALRVVSPQRLFELLRQEGHAETDEIPQERAPGPWCTGPSSVRPTTWRWTLSSST